jgi:hypothetical protein
MEFHQKLPRNKKEFALFIAVISVLSVNIIAPLITCFEFGFHLAVWKDTLSVIPFIWLSVIVLVLLTHKPAEWLTQKLIHHEDSFNAHILASIIFTVLLMSVFLTVIGTWIGSRSITAEPLIYFFHKWPRNFAISFGVEAIIAQPIARFVMKRYHRFADARTVEAK